jgi:hypothetical protein
MTAKEMLDKCNAVSPADLDSLVKGLGNVMVFHKASPENN